MLTALFHFPTVKKKNLTMLTTIFKFTNYTYYAVLLQYY